MSPNRDGTPKPDEIPCGCLPIGRDDAGAYAALPAVEVRMVKWIKVAKDEEIELSRETEQILQDRKDGCFLCRFILEDQEAHGKLTAYPFDLEGKGQFPVEAKVNHVAMEKASSPGPEARGTQSRKA